MRSTEPKTSISFPCPSHAPAPAELRGGGIISSSCLVVWVLGNHLARTRDACSRRLHFSFRNHLRDALPRIASPQSPPRRNRVVEKSFCTVPETRNRIPPGTPCLNGILSFSPFHRRDLFHTIATLILQAQASMMLARRSREYACMIATRPLFVRRRHRRPSAAVGDARKGQLGQFGQMVGPSFKDVCVWCHGDQPKDGDTEARRSRYGRETGVVDRHTPFVRETQATSSLCRC